MKKILCAVFMVLSVGIFSWMGLSWVDVVSHNLDPNPQYNEYNMFVLIDENF